MGFINNSYYAVEATKFVISKVGDWGYVGISVDNLESVYGIHFHGDEDCGYDYNRVEVEAISSRQAILKAEQHAPRGAKKFEIIKKRFGKKL